MATYRPQSWIKAHTETSKKAYEPSLREIYENQDMTFELAEIYFQQWEKVKEYFSKQTLEYVLRKYKVKDFTTKEYAETTNHSLNKYYLEKKFFCFTDKPETYTAHDFVMHNGQTYEAWVDKIGYGYLIPSGFRTNEGNFLLDCVLTEYPMLSMFEISTYTLNYGKELTDEFYLKLKPNTPSLYVPYLALKNPDLIAERMEKYFSEYYRGKPDMYELNMATLKYPEFKILYNYLKGE